MDKSALGLVGLVVGAVTILTGQAMMAHAARPSVPDRQWVSEGPYGGTVLSLAVDPSSPATLYAGTGGGVYKSTDGGATWVAARRGLSETLPITSLAIHPSDSSLIYAGTDYAGVYRSEDAGISWRPWGMGLEFQSVQALAIDPSDPARMYAGMAAGLFRSLDGGATWDSLGWERATIYEIVVDPVSPLTVYAANCSNGLIKSTDGGDTWTKMNQGLGRCALALAMDPMDHQLLYAAGLGVYVSSDGAQTWEPLGLRGTNPLDIEVLPGSGIVYMATYADGIFRTSDGGETWEKVNEGLQELFVFSLASHPSGSPVYAGLSGSGVFSSTDGATWEESTAGITNLNIFALALDPLEPSTLYVTSFWGYSGAPAGLFKSTDGGRSWYSSDEGIVTDAATLAVAVNPLTEGTVYVGTNGAGVFKSTDGGATWGTVNRGLSNRDIIALVHHPRRDDTIFAASNSAGVFLSVNGGEWWQDRSNGLTDTYVSQMAIAASDPETLYVAASSHLFRTTNGGEAWQRVINGLPDNGLTAVSIDPIDSLVAYVGGFRGLFKTTDGGDTWTEVGSPSGIVGVIEIDPSDPATIYAGTSIGVFVSTDGAATWSMVDPDGMRARFVTDLLATPTGKLFAGTSVGSVYVTRLPG